MVEAIIEGLEKAFQLILSGDPEVLSISARSILVSGTATLLAAAWSLPLGLVIGVRRFRGKRIVRSIFNTLLGIPTVALGVILYLGLSRSGPLGSLHLLYTPAGMALGQALLITPIAVSFITSAIESVDPEIRHLAKTLGASETEASFAVLRESAEGVGLAITASFNRAVAELGVALMIGGNIRGSTRVLTTAIAIETGRGELALGIALTIILLLLVAAISVLMNVLGSRR